MQQCLRHAILGCAILASGCYHWAETPMRSNVTAPLGAQTELSQESSDAVRVDRTHVVRWRDSALRLRDAPSVRLSLDDPLRYNWESNEWTVPGLSLPVSAGHVEGLYQWRADHGLTALFTVLVSIIGAGLSATGTVFVIGASFEGGG